MSSESELAIADDSHEISREGSAEFSSKVWILSLGSLEVGIFASWDVVVSVQVGDVEEFVNVLEAALFVGDIGNYTWKCGVVLWLDLALEISTSISDFKEVPGPDVSSHRHPEK